MPQRPERGAASQLSAAEGPARRSRLIRTGHVLLVWANCGVRLEVSIYLSIYLEVFAKPRVVLEGWLLLPPQTPCSTNKTQEHAAMRLLLCGCLVAFGDAQLRPRRVGVSPMGEETGAAEAGGAEPDMANLMKNMMGGGAARSKCSQQPTWPPTAPEAHPLAHGCLWAR